MGRKNDGSLCWTYTGAGNRTYCRILWGIWLCLMLLLFVCMGFVAAMTQLQEDMKPFLLHLSLGIAGFVTLVFVLIWLWERFVPKKYSYALNEKELTVNTGRYRHLPLNQIKGLKQNKSRDAILLKHSPFPLEIFVPANDYDEVWHFLLSSPK